MALKEYTIDIPLGGGLDQKTHPNLVEAPNVRALENYQFDKIGSVNKREGYAELNTPSDSPLSKTFAPTQNQILSLGIDGTQLYEELVDTWRTTNDGILPCITNNTPLFASSETNNFGGPWNIDCASMGPYRCTVWDTATPGFTDHIWVTVTSENGREVILAPIDITKAPYSITLGMRPRVLGFDGDFHIVALDAGGNINYTRLTPTTLVFSAPVVVTGGVDYFDAHVFDESQLTFHIVTTTGGTDTTAHEVDNAGVIVNTVGPLVGANQLSPGGRTIYHNDAFSRVYLGVVDYTAAPDIAHASIISFADSYLGAVTTQANVLNHASDVGIAQTQISIGPRDAATNGLWLVMGGATSTASAWSAFVDLDNTGNDVAGTTGDLINWFPRTKIFQPLNHPPMFGSTFRFGANFPYESTESLGVYQVTTPVGLVLARSFTPDDEPRLRVVARYHQDKIDVIQQPTEGTNLTAAPNAAIFPGLVRLAGLRGNATIIRGVELLQLEFAPNRLTTIPSGNSTFVASGCVGNVDVVSSTEVCPHTAPYLPDVTQNAVGVGAGFTSFVVCFVTTDRFGRIYRSAPTPATPAFDLSAGLEFDITLALRPPSFFEEYFDNPLKYEIYASYDVTAASAEVGPFYRQTTIEEGTPNAPPFFGLFTDTVTLSSPVDTDDVLLYTSGGVLDNICPPGFLDATQVNGRIWGISSESRDTVWFSQSRIPTTPPEFNANLAIQILDAGFAGTAITSMDDKVVIFGEDKIMFLAGDGPNNTGEGADFLGPQLISAEVGCHNRNSVISGPFGVIFEGARGLFALDRGLNIQFIGAPVEDIVANNTILSADLVPEKNHVRFVLDAAQPTILIYDYEVDTWGVFLFSVNLEPLQSSMVFGGRHYVWGESEFSQQQDGLYADRGEWYGTRLLTNWFKLQNVAGYQRIWEMNMTGDYTSGDFTIEAHYDYDDSSVSTHAWTEAEILAFPDGFVPLELRVQPRIQKTMSIAFNMFEVSPIGPPSFGAGISINRLTLSCGIKTGTFRVPAENAR